MIERLGLATVPDLEAALVDLGTAIELPPTPDLATTVGVQIRAARSVSTPSPVVPFRRPVVRSLQRSLLLAAAVTLLVVGAALGVRFGLALLEIDFGPLPSPSTTPVVSASPGAEVRIGARLGLGVVATLDEARLEAAFPLLVPAALGDPDQVYLGGTSLRGQVAFIYLPRDDLPASDLLAGAALLVTQNRGRFDQGLARKLIDTGEGGVVPVDVDGAPGYWIGGEPHFFWYLAPDGEAIQESQRQVGHTLAWERDGILYRIEGAPSKERALELARSMSGP
jgi:hypothetical protein